MMEGQKFEKPEARNLHNARWILFTLKVGSLTTDDLVDIDLDLSSSSLNEK